MGENPHLENNLRDTMVEIGRRMWDKNMVASNDGNLSARLGVDCFLMTPSGVSKGFMKPEDLLIVDDLGNILSGNGRVTTESKMHLTVYRRRKDVNAVVHAHPVFATTFAAAEIPLDQPILTEMILTLGTIPMAPYATPSTDEVGFSIEAAIEDHDAILLSHHGALTLGKDLSDAYFKMERVEYCAHIYFNLVLWGQVRELPEESVHKLLDVKAHLGI